MSADDAVAAPRAFFPAFARTARETPDPPTPPTVEDVRERARRDGHAEGLVRGREEAMSVMTTRVAAVLGALERAIDDLRAARAAVAADVARALPSVVVMLAGKIVHRELAADDAVVALTRAVCEAVAEPGLPVVLRLSPAAVTLLDAAGARTVAGVRVEADTTLALGDYVVETPHGIGDGRIDTQLEEALRHLAEAGT